MLDVGRAVVVSVRCCSCVVGGEDALHGVLPALDARSGLRGRRDVLDYLSNLLLQLADFLDLRVIDGSDEDQAYSKARISGLAAR